MKVKLFSVPVTSIKTLEKAVNDYCDGKNVASISVEPQGSIIIATVVYSESNEKIETVKTSEPKRRRSPSKPQKK